MRRGTTWTQARRLLPAPALADVKVSQVVTNSGVRVARRAFWRDQRSSRTRRLSTDNVHTQERLQAAHAAWLCLTRVAGTGSLSQHF